MAVIPARQGEVVEWQLAKVIWFSSKFRKKSIYRASTDTCWQLLLQSRWQANGLHAKSPHCKVILDSSTRECCWAQSLCLSYPPYLLQIKGANELFSLEKRFMQTRLGNIGIWTLSGVQTTNGFVRSPHFLCLFFSSWMVLQYISKRYYLAPSR